MSIECMKGRERLKLRGNEESAEARPSESADISRRAVVLYGSSASDQLMRWAWDVECRYLVEGCLSRNPEGPEHSLIQYAQPALSDCTVSSGFLAGWSGLCSCASSQRGASESNRSSLHAIALRGRTGRQGSPYQLAVWGEQQSH